MKNIIIKSMGKRMSKSELKIYELIDKILWKEWDPIGVYSFKEAARDEYCTYFPKVYGMVVSNKSKKEISDYLFNVEQEQMSLSGNRKRCNKIAAMVLMVSGDKYLK